MPLPSITSASIASDFGSIENKQSTTQNAGDVLSVPLAFISNSSTCDLRSPTDLLISLQAHDLSYEDFLDTFFHSRSVSFNVNPNRKNWRLLIFNEQTYKVHDNVINFNLYESHRDAFSLKNNLPKNQISLVDNLLLRKELNSIHSLAGSFAVQIATNLYDTLQELVVDGHVEKSSDMSKTVAVSFTLQVLTHSKILDTTVAVVFAFNVNVPGFTCAASGSLAQPAFAAVAPYSDAEFFNDDNMDSLSIDYQTIATNDITMKTKDILKMNDDGASENSGSDANSGFENHVKW